MANYGGIQLPNINEQSMDDRKERRQILNYLQLLDEKLKYMFQNIDIEENLSADSQEMFFQYGKDIQNVIKDTEGNFSLFEQTINGISLQVQDLEGNHAILQQTAEGLVSAVGSVEGSVSLFQQTAERIETSVYDLDEELGNVSSTATQTAKELRWIVESGSSASSLVLTKNMIKAITDQVEIRADVDLYGYMAVWRDDGYDVVGGYIGYANGDDGVNASTSGIKVASDGLNSDEEAISYLIATNSGVRMTYQDPDDEDVKSGVMATADGPSMVYEDKNSDERHEVYCNRNGARMQYSDEDVTNYIRAMSSGIRMYAGDFRIYFDDTYGNLYPYDDDMQMLGQEDYRWQGVWADNGEIQTSDANEKHSIEYNMEKYETLFNLLKPTQFKKDSGSSDRYHIGYISQDVEKAIEEAGLTSQDFAGFIKSPLYPRDEKGKKILDGEILGYRYALRYSEFVALNTHMIQKLMKRVEDLENKLEALS